MCGENSLGNSWGGGPGPSWGDYREETPTQGRPYLGSRASLWAGAGDRGRQRRWVEGGGQGWARSPWWLRTVRQPMQQLCRLAKARRPPTLPVSTVLHRVWSPPAGEG